MSGHSHYATIKRQKEAKDAAKGREFSRLARGIQIAVKSGGGTDPDANYKLRMAIEAARSSNMPKENIERAIKAAQAKSGDLEEVIYEGYGPGGIAVIVEGVTDNKSAISMTGIEPVHVVWKPSLSGVVPATTQHAKRQIVFYNVYLLVVLNQGVFMLGLVAHNTSTI